MNMGVNNLIFGSFVILYSFYQADAEALDTIMRTKRAICGENLSSKQGVIESPNYPSSYPSYSRCTWHISAPTNSRITLKFVSFQLESSGSCNFDHLEIRDGSSETSNLLTRLCGSSIPNPIESTGNSVTLIFKTDGSSQYRGFKIEFSASSTCGGDLTADQGEINTPGYPRNYGNNEECTWTITVPNGYQVMLRFRSFQLEESPVCNADSLQVFDGPDTNSQRLEKFCGTGITEDIQSSRNMMTLLFVSDASHNFRGFSAQYAKVKRGKEQRPVQSMASRNIPVVSMVGALLWFSFLAFM